MARSAKPAAQSESWPSRLMHTVPLAVAFYLLAVTATPWPALNIRFLQFSPAMFWLGAALTAAGLALAVWARLLLGGNWSSNVTIKQDHQLVATGPYRWVRHPIYTGLLLALCGSALTVGEWRGPLAVLVAAASLWRKLRIEETFMGQQFGDAYAAYSRHTAALIPFLL